MWVRSPQFRSATPFDTSIQYIALPQESLVRSCHSSDQQYKSDHRLTQLLCRAYDEHFTSPPPSPPHTDLMHSFNPDNPRYDALMVECYRTECYDVPVLQSVSAAVFFHA